MNGFCAPVLRALSTTAHSLRFAVRRAPALTFLLVTMAASQAVLPGLQVTIVSWASEDGAPDAGWLIALAGGLLAVGITVTASLVKHASLLLQLRLRQEYADDLSKILAEQRPEDTLDPGRVNALQGARDAVPFNLAWQATSGIAVLGAVAAMALLSASLWAMSPLAGILVALVLVPDLFAHSRIARIENDTWPKLAEHNRRSEYLESVLSFAPASTELAASRGSLRVGSLLRHEYRAQHELMARAPRAGLRLSLASGVVAWVIATAALAALLQGERDLAAITAGLVGVMAGLVVTRGAGLAFGELMASAPLIVAYEHLAREHAAMRRSSIVEEPRHEPVQELVARHLAYTYPSATRSALSDASITLRAGQLTALVGTNGGGKTTLAKCVAGLLAPDSGSVCITTSGAEITNPAARRQHVSFLFQDFGRFELTVREFVDPSAARTDDSIWAALRAAKAGAFVEHLRNGIDTQLGPQWGGAGLSGGQWQRLAVARTVLSEAPIWILDEPTAAIDAVAEEEIYRELAVHKRDRILLVISHRPQTLAAADVIHVVGEGRVLESGTYDELVAQRGHFQALLAASKVSSP